MSIELKKLYVCLFLTFFVAGCMGAQTTTGEKPADGTAAARTTQDGKTQVSADPAAEKPAPEVKKPQVTVEQAQQRRLLEKELERDATEYWVLVKERNVEKAIKYVVADKREEVQKSLWRFISVYRVESADLKDKNVGYPVIKDKGNTSFSVTLYDKKTASFKNKEFNQQWKYLDGRWYLHQ